MGLLDTIISTVVLRYKVESKEAVADIKNMSKEQQRAAKESADALKKQGETAQSMGEKYAKGAAVIAGAYVIARESIEALHTQSRLAAGSVGVDLDKLRRASGGLRTEWELMTIAQAGSQGAWKLTTQQLEFVIEGMRALEKKGYDATEVQNALTESLKKGKLEGLDKFGLSIKSTGTAAGDLRSLMRQLATQVRDVGHNFDKAGDAATRAGVKFANLRNKTAASIGTGLDYGIQGVEAVGQGAAALVSGGSYFQEDLGAQLLGFGAKAQRVRMGIDAESRRARQEQKRALAEDVGGLFSMIEGWKKRADALPEEAKGGGGAASAGNFYGSLLERGGLFASRLGAFGAAERGREQTAAARARRELDQRAREDAAYAQSKVLNADALRAMTAADELAAAGAEKSWLAAVFGPVEEFETYKEALTSLADVTQGVAGQMYDAWTSGAELSGKAIRKMIGAEIAAEGKKLLVRGISGVLTGAYHTATGDPRGPLEMAAGGAMIAGSVAIGAIAREVGGSSSGSAPSIPRGGGGSAAGVAGAGEGARPVIVIQGDGWADDSPRYRDRSFRAAQGRADRYAPPGGISHG